MHPFRVCVADAASWCFVMRSALSVFMAAVSHRQSEIQSPAALLFVQHTSFTTHVTALAQMIAVSFRCLSVLNALLHSPFLPRSPMPPLPFSSVPSFTHHCLIGRQTVSCFHASRERRAIEGLLLFACAAPGITITHSPTENVTYVETKILTKRASSCLQSRRYLLAVPIWH